jgi:hypothetical protein
MKITSPPDNMFTNAGCFSLFLSQTHLESLVAAAAATRELRFAATLRETNLILPLQISSC